MRGNKKSSKPGAPTLTQLMEQSRAGDREAAEAVVGQVSDLMAKAQDGDSEAMSQLLTAFRDSPKFWELSGELARIALTSQIDMMLGDDLLSKESLRRHADAMRDELAGPNPTPLERLLADRIVVCWVQVLYADTKYAQSAQNLSMAWGDYYQRRQDRAHRRFLSACKTLATVRKLEIPALQVNVAEKQVNIAAANAAFAGSETPKASAELAGLPKGQEPSGTA